MGPAAPERRLEAEHCFRGNCDPKLQHLLPGSLGFFGLFIYLFISSSIPFSGAVLDPDGIPRLWLGTVCCWRTDPLHRPEGRKVTCDACMALALNITGFGAF